MRLFVAIELEENVLRTAAGIAEELRRRTARLAPTARVTWLTPERLHVTLSFIGESDQAQASAIADCLRPPFDGPPFDLTVAGLGAFPERGSPRVLWAGIAAGRDRLLDLEAQLRARWARGRVPVDERPYRPHLTLARVREAAGLRAAALLEGLERTLLGTTPVEAITLFESRLSPKGPTYVALQRTNVARM